MLSSNINCTSGKRIAKGIPGNPPPVPASRTLSIFWLSPRLITLAIAKE